MEREFKIWRGNAKGGDFSTYSVKLEQGMVVLDALHKIHPLAGQGFNMCIRDIIGLKKIINEKNKLGLDIGDKSSLNEFSNKMKSRNFIYSSSIEILNDLFSIKEKPVTIVRDIAIQNINKSKLLKRFFLNFANKGLIF